MNLNTDAYAILEEHKDNTEEQAVSVLARAVGAPAALDGAALDLASFELLHPISESSISVVIKARHKPSGSVFALKVYFTKELSDVRRHSLDREIALHITLDHPNIIKLYAAFQEGDFIVLVEEYAGKGDLFRLVHQHGGKLPEAVTAIHVIKPLLDALEYMHSKRIAHRDVKPENVLFDEHLQLKLGDFGVAVNGNDTLIPLYAGTPDYMAPEVVSEQWTHGPYEDVRAAITGVDMWATGVMLYEILVGFPPTSRDSGGCIDPSSIEYPMRMSPAAKDLITTMLVEDPASRPSAAEVRQHVWLALQEGHVEVDQYIPFESGPPMPLEFSPPAHGADLERMDSATSEQGGCGNSASTCWSIFHANSSVSPHMNSRVSSFGGMWPMTRGGQPASGSTPAVQDLRASRQPSWAPEFLDDDLP